VADGQLRGVRGEQGGDLLFQFTGFGVQGQPAAAQGSQRAAIRAP
jgi:hypothetical protein